MSFHKLNHFKKSSIIIIMTIQFICKRLYFCGLKSKDSVICFSSHPEIWRVEFVSFVFMCIIQIPLVNPQEKRPPLCLKVNQWTCPEKNNKTRKTKIEKNVVDKNPYLLTFYIISPLLLSSRDVTPNPSVVLIRLPHPPR